MAEGAGPEAGASTCGWTNSRPVWSSCPGQPDRLPRLWLGGRRRRRAGRGRPRPGRRRASPYKAAPPTRCAARRVARCCKLDDPAGHALEVFLRRRAGQPPVGQPVREPLRNRRAGLGHVVLPVPAGTRPRSASGPTSCGFRLRDSMRMAPELFGGQPGDRSGLVPLPRLQPAAPLAGPGPGPGGPRHRAPDDRGRLAGRRGPGAGPVRQARRNRYRARWGGTPTT